MTLYKKIRVKAICFVVGVNRCEQADNIFMGVMWDLGALTSTQGHVVLMEDKKSDFLGIFSFIVIIFRS